MIAPRVCATWPRFALSLDFHFGRPDQDLILDFATTWQTQPERLKALDLVCC